MSQKERNRSLTLGRVKEGVMTIVEAARHLGLSYRQARRVAKRHRQWGDAGLVHGSRGRVSNRRLDAGLKGEALRLFEAHYGDYGPTLASEVLAEEHGLLVHAETLRRWLRGACLLTPRTAARKHRRRRARRERLGEMTQMDGSFHDWFEGRSAPCNLMVAVDDATGLTLCFFSEQETLASAYELLRQWIMRLGVPESLYVDRRSMYVADREATSAERRAGTGALTDFGRACLALGIGVILARSPQAKGRVERKNAVLQDRLVKAMRRKGIRSIAAANAFLPAFLKDFNKRFSRQAASAVDRHRKAPGKGALNELLCRQEERTVANDWTISCQSAAYQIDDAACQPRQKVTVRHHLDGTVAILREGQRLRFREALA